MSKSNTTLLDVESGKRLSAKPSSPVKEVGSPPHTHTKTVNERQLRPSLLRLETSRSDATGDNEDEEEEERFHEEEDEDSDVDLNEKRKTVILDDGLMIQQDPVPKKSLATLKNLRDIHQQEEFGRSHIVLEDAKNKSSLSLASQSSTNKHHGDNNNNNNSKHVHTHPESPNSKESHKKSAKSSNDVNPVSIMSTTYKQTEKKVLLIRDDDSGATMTMTMTADEEGEESLENNNYNEEEEMTEESDSSKSYVGGRFTINSVRSGITFANLVENPNKDRLTLAMELYKDIQGRTYGKLLERHKTQTHPRLDTYCLGRGILEPQIQIQDPYFPEKLSLIQETLTEYSSFVTRIQELEEQNSDLKQIICVFTASFVSSRKTWNEDCNLVEAAVAFMARFLDISCHLVWVRVGSHREWKDPANPYRTNRHISLKNIPTIMVWGTEKRLAGNRLLNLENIAVLLED